VPVDMRMEDLDPVAHGEASFIPPAAQSDQLGKTLCYDGGSDASKGDDSYVLHGFSDPDRSKCRSC